MSSAIDTTCRNGLLTDGYLKANCLNTDTRTKDNIIADIIEAEKNKNTLFVAYKITDYTKITDATFKTPEFIQYRNGVDFLIDDLPISYNVFAVKISTFITIATGGLYCIEFGKGYGVVNMYIDNILINSTPSGSYSNTTGVYISTGMHYVYFEVTSDNAHSANYRSNQLPAFAFSASLYPKGGTKTSINNYITTPYTLLTTITNTKNSADINYCKTGGLLTNDYCKALLKNKTILNDSVTNYCFDPTTKKFNYNPECIDLVKKTVTGDLSINTQLTASNTTNLNNWITTNLGSLDKLSADDLTKFRDLYIMVNDSTKDGLVTLTNTTKALPTYCENTLGDVYNIENNKNTLCNYVYSNTTFQNSQPIKDSINNIRRNYCSKKIGDNFRYETDANCQDMVKGSDLLNPTLNTRCIVNGKFNIDDPYCNSLVDNYDPLKPPTNKTLFDGLTTSKISYMKDEIANISKDKPTLKTLDYATKKYKTYSTAKPADDILQPSLINYCEVEDPMLSSNINTCKSIYNAYEVEPKIKDSRSRMRFSNCTKPENIMTNNNTDVDIAKNLNQCNLLASDLSNISNLSRIAPVMNANCSTGDNIITDTCKTFYSNIESKFLDQFKPKAAFTNKEGFRSKECVDEKSIDPKPTIITNPDGSTSKITINADGSKTIEMTVINTDGSKTITITNPDGSQTITTTNVDKPQVLINNEEIHIHKKKWEEEYWWVILLICLIFVGLISGKLYLNAQKNKSSSLFTNTKLNEKIPLV